MLKKLAIAYPPKLWRVRIDPLDHLPNGPLKLPTSFYMFTHPGDQLDYPPTMNEWGGHPAKSTKLVSHQFHFGTWRTIPLNSN